MILRLNEQAEKNLSKTTTVAQPIGRIEVNEDGITVRTPSHDNSGASFTLTENEFLRVALEVFNSKCERFVNLNQHFKPEDTTDAQAQSNR